MRKIMEVCYARKRNILLFGNRELFKPCKEYSKGNRWCGYSIGRITDRREHYHNPKVKAEDLMEDIIHVDI